MSLEFYHYLEKRAVDQISVRVIESGGDWRGWTSNEIIHPERHKFHFNPNNIMGHFGFGRRRPDDKLYEPLNEFERFVKFKELLREFDPFIVIDNFNDSTFSNNEWLLETCNAARRRGLYPCRGLAYFNRFDWNTGKRLAEKIALLKVTCPKSGIYAQLVDCVEMDSAGGFKVKAMKILMCSNPNRVNPFAVRRFIKILKTLLLDDRGYGIAWGNPAVMNQEEYPHNAGEGHKDKRFGTYETKTFYLSEDKSKDIEISNLAHYWCCVGFQLMLSPDYDGNLCVAMVAESLQKKLLEKDELVWSQFFEKA